MCHLEKIVEHPLFGKLFSIKTVSCRTINYSGKLSSLKRD